MSKPNKPTPIRSKQSQSRQPGVQTKMKPQPISLDKSYLGSGKLNGKIALITGGDSGIGRSVAIYFAKEGADVAIVYLNEHKDAKETQALVEQEGRKCLLISGDVAKETFCKQAVSKTKKFFEKIDILVNNAAVQYPQKSITKITKQQLEKTFATNIFSYFYMTKAVLKYFKRGSDH